MKAVTFLIFLISISFALFASELEKEKPSYPEIITSLNTHCAKCSYPSLEIFELNITQLEWIIGASEKGLFYKKGVQILQDSYMQLIFEFSHANDTKVKIIIDKLYQLALESIQTTTDIQEVRYSVKRMYKKFTNITLSNPPNQTVSLYYNQTVEKLKLDSDIIVRSMLNGKSLRDYLTNNTSGNIKRISSATQVLFKRIQFLNLSEKDKMLIKTYQNAFYSYRNFKKHISSKEKQHLLEVLIQYMKSYQLPIQELKELRRTVIVARTQSRNNNYFEDVIWWGEARNNTNTEEQLVFLNNQMLSKRRDDVIKMLIELGQVETVEKWSKELNFENSVTIFNLAIRQAKLREATLEKKSNLAKLINNEYKLSIAEIIQQKQKDNQIYQQHIQWIIIQLGTHNKNNKFKKILENLAQDNLYYNKQETKKLSLKEKHQLSKELEMKFEISSNAQFVLNPTDKE